MYLHFLPYILYIIVEQYFNSAWFTIFKVPRYYFAWENSLFMNFPKTDWEKTENVDDQVLKDKWNCQIAVSPKVPDREGFKN